LAAGLPSLDVWLIVIFPFAGALLTPLLSKFDRARNYVAVLFSGLSAAFAFLLLLPVLQGQPISVYDSVIPTSVPWIPELGINMGVLFDPYTIIISNVVASVSFLIMIYSLDYMKGEHGLTRYWFFMNFFLGNMQLIVLSNNLLALFIGWEGVGLCSYALIGFHYSDRIEDWVGTPGQKALGEEQAYSPSHAGMKAFVMTKVGDVAMLIGIIILFLYSKTFSFQSLASSSAWATSLSNAGLLVPVALLIFGGAIGKSAQFPLQEWLPDAMAGPAPVSALIHAATMVKAGVVLVARIGPIFYFALAADPALIQPFFVTVAWIGAFTAFLAATQGLVGFELKKILAYSTVSQVGYMIMALGLTGLSPDFAQGLSAGLFQLMSHAIFKACLFMAAGVLIHVTGSKYISDMGGLKERMKLTLAVVLIAAASLSGIPPLSGFWSKDAVLATAWDSGQLGLFAVGAVTAGLTAFYTFRMVGMIFFGKKSAHLEELEKAGHPPHEVGILGWAPYAILGVVTIIIGVLAPVLGIEGSLEGAATAYIHGLFPGATVSSAAAAAAAASFNFASAGVAFVFVLIGVGAAWAIYIANRVPPARFVGEKGLMHGLYKFLENRWYINAIYYRVFVDPAISGSRWLLNQFEVNGLEKVNGAAAAFGIYLSRAGNWVDARVIDAIAGEIAIDGESLSRAFRRVQTGILEQYTLIFTMGLLFLLLAYLFGTGALAR
jgi:NADH-quinone oxidoreductase subunit L